MPRRRLDARSLIAFAHPIRVRIRDRLRRVGPATATLLAEEFGESTASMSYHLRMLARHGFIELVHDRGRGRERWWRATDEVVQIFPSDFVDDATAGEALRVLDAERRRIAEERLGRWLAGRERWEAAWRDAAENSVFSSRLSARETRALADELIAVIDRHMAREADGTGEPDEAARIVEIQLNVFPTGRPS